jgi:hypothetical protein
MGIAAGLGIAGRTLVGWLMPPRANRRVIACASYGVQAVGSVLAALAYGSSTSALLLGVCLFGVGIGNATSLPPMIAQTEFARGDVQRIVSLAVAIAQVRVRGLRRRTLARYASDVRRGGGRSARGDRVPAVAAPMGGLRDAAEVEDGLESGAPEVASHRRVSDILPVRGSRG